MTTPLSKQELGIEGFTALLDAAVDAIVIIDHRGQILAFNPAAQELFLYDTEEVLNQNVKILMPEPYSAQHDLYLHNYLTTGVQKIIGTGRRVEGLTKNGTIFPMELSVGEFSSNNSRYFVGIIRDLSESERVTQALRQSEAQLRENEEALKVTLDNAPIGIFILNEDSCIISANQAAVTLTGRAANDVKGTHIRELAHPDDWTAMENHRAKLLENKKASFVLPIRYVRKDRTVAYATMHCSRVEGKTDKDSAPMHNQPRFIAQLVDQTDQRRAEEQASEFRERLALVDRISTMGEMASGIAHEINQPLTAISSYVQACRRRLDANNLDPEKLKELLEKTDEQAQRAGNIVQSIRAMIRKHDQVRERVDVNRLVENTASLASVDAGNRQITVQLQLLPFSGEVIVDEIQIQQVILNLVRNAIDATEASADSERGNTKTIVVGTRPSTEPDNIEIWVRDYGCGIPHSLKEKLFDSFVTSKATGTGLGLSISRNIIDAHGGKINAVDMLTQKQEFDTRNSSKIPESAPIINDENTRGSLFYFTLPLAIEG